MCSGQIITYSFGTCENSSILPSKVEDLSQAKSSNNINNFTFNINYINLSFDIFAHSECVSLLPLPLAIKYPVAHLISEFNFPIIFTLLVLDKGEFFLAVNPDTLVMYPH